MTNEQSKAKLEEARSLLATVIREYDQDEVIPEVVHTLTAEAVVLCGEVMAGTAFDETKDPRDFDYDDT
jgi:hypothetical protein